MQYHGNKIGATIDRKPKCHPEITGEGIEYCWALSKLHYRLQPIANKKGKDNFRNLVRQSTSNKSVLKIKQVRKCARRAREYMLVYAASYSVQNELKINKKTQHDTHAINIIKKTITS